MSDQNSIFLFKVRRKLSRELRKRTLPFYGAWARRGARSALAGKTSRELLIEFGKLAPWGTADGTGPSVTEWADSAEAEAIVDLADRSCAHVFDLLGSGEVHLGSEIDWHLDFKTGYRWGADDHFLNIQWDRLPAGTDIKVPWELSRCQHFASLGFADWISGDKKYYEEFKCQLQSWIKSNPYDQGVNWVCTMDVAIRAVNWLNALMMFHHRLQDEEDEGFCRMLIESLWLHGRHIWGNLEWLGPRSRGLANHFLADIVGLLAIGTLFSGTSWGRRYLEFSRNWLETEMIRQVFEDGALYETSTSYHRLSFELLLWSDTMAGQVGLPFSQAYRCRLGRMIDFTRAYTAPSGLAAHYGDNDSGRLLRCGIDDEGDHRYLMGGECGSGGRANRMLLRGNIPLPTGDREGAGDFSDAGFWFMRNDRAWVGMRAGVVSHRGSHGHCDQLSVVLGVSGVDIIVDPGTAIYSANPEKRGRYRSSAAHNSCRVNGWEANSFRDGMAGLFQLGDETATEVLKWKIDGDGGVVVGRHHGFERFRSGMTVQRSMTLLSSGLEITDTIELLNLGDRVELGFHFAPGVGLVKVEDGIVASSNGVRVLLRPDERVTTKIVDASYSPGYGVEEPCLGLVMEAQVAERGTGVFKFRAEWRGES